MTFELTIAEGRGRGQRFEFEADDVLIGRGVENDVVLNDAGVSRLHARIVQQGELFVVADNGSSNGTELNGVLLERPAQLRSGDRIGVGPVVFTFTTRAQAGEATRITALPKADGETTRVTGKPRSGSFAAEATRVSSLPVQAEPRVVAPRAAAPQAPRALAGAGLALLARLRALPDPVRYGAVAVLVSLLGLAVWGLARSEREGGLACPETVAVDDDTAAYTFGRGPVDVDCGASVAFGFSVPARTRVLFHYVATHVGAASELELKLNGKHLAWAPVAASRGEVQVLPVPDELLSNDGRNVVSFHETQRGKEWSVGKVRVELLALTPGDLKAAREAYERGRRKLAERRVAPRNLYDAWKAFVQARRQLTGLSPKPALYDEVAQLIKDAERDLEKECSTLLFSAARFEKYGQDDKAQQAYKEVLAHFPGEDPSGCRKKARENLTTQPVAASEATE